MGSVSAARQLAKRNVSPTHSRALPAPVAPGGAPVSRGHGIPVLGDQSSEFRVYFSQSGCPFKPPGADHPYEFITLSEADAKDTDSRAWEEMVSKSIHPILTAVSGPHKYSASTALGPSHAVPPVCSPLPTAATSPHPSFHNPPHFESLWCAAADD